MAKQIIDITPAQKIIPGRKRVAAYARVSCDKDTMLHSLAAQIDYYRKYIMQNPEWEFAGVYADEAKTGTKDDREQFQKLLVDCRAGLIDMVVVKSISRLARNTVTLLSTVRELKAMDIDVFFEEQNIHIMSEEGELLLTLLASQAQEESLAVSDNCKWRIRKGFEQGRASTCTMLGYRLIGGEITAVPEEIPIVREIFDMYISGWGYQKICNELNERGVRTEKIKYWYQNTVRKILRNEKYVGDILLQKTLCSDHISKRQIPNEGQLPQYYVTDDHEPLVPRELFNSVQAEVQRRAEQHTHAKGTSSALTGKVRCGICGKNYRRKTTAYNVVWCCSTFNQQGKAFCASKAIPETTLKTVVAAALGWEDFTEERFNMDVDHIFAEPGNMLTIKTVDGEEHRVHWQDRSRSESWTPEMREAASQKTRMRKENTDGK